MNVSSVEVPDQCVIIGKHLIVSSEIGGRPGPGIEMERQ